ncbi:hypothetical protein [Bifidobacterium adolescentis]|uniref:hypothetical protein n=1 Tax=Bifidobacterium adolescentis TaxID=1680 RepID=UPI0022E29CBB|nr:hypothetical protein [Bifidobacterium adolescentis]
MRLNSESIETILERFDRRDDADADYVMAHWREAVDVYEHDGSAGLADQSERDVMRVWAEDELAQVVEDHYWNFPGGRNSCMEFYSRPDFISESYVEWKAGLLSEGDLERTDRADTDPLGDPRAFGATTPTR